MQLVQQALPKTRDSVFERSGIADVRDLQDPEWLSIISELETRQLEFLEREPHSPEYAWPKDALHFWSRIWEYPYVYYHLRCLQKKVRQHPLRILDYGSGVTFFPFAVSRLGCDVTCIDVDLVCERDMNRAIVEFGDGRVHFQRTDGRTIPFPPSYFDAVYSVSVLEHIAEPCLLLPEFSRVLRDGGELLLTLDVDLDQVPSGGIGVREYETILQGLEDLFDWVYPRTLVHPGAMLTMARGPHAFYSTSELRSILRSLRSWVKRQIHGRRAKRPLNLTCEGLVVSKK